MQPVTIFMNRHSGTVQRLGEDRVLEMVHEAFGDRLRSAQLMDPPDIITHLKAVAANPEEGILVGGGDGTAVCAAEILGPAKVPFGILPLGTMNLLAQDLGAGPSLEETLAYVDKIVPHTIDVGMVNGHMFLCSAVIGVIPESAVVREELRENVTIESMARFLSTVRRGLGGETKQQLYLKSRTEDKPYMIETTSLIISNNSFVKSPAMGTERFLRETLQDGKLAVYSATPKDILDGLKMALSLWQGDWQEHGSIRSFEAEELIVSTEQKDILVSIDGEPRTMQTPLHFTLKPRSLPIYRMELVS